MRGDHDGTELVAQGSLGTGLAPVLLYPAWSISPSSSALSLVIQPSLTTQPAAEGLMVLHAVFLHAVFRRGVKIAWRVIGNSAQEASSDEKLLYLQAMLHADDKRAGSHFPFSFWFNPLNISVFPGLSRWCSECQRHVHLSSCYLTCCNLSLIGCFNPLRHRCRRGTHIWWVNCCIFSYYYCCFFKSLSRTLVTILIRGLAPLTRLIFLIQYD